MIPISLWLTSVGFLLNWVVFLYQIQHLSPSLHTTTAGVPILTGDFLAEMAACPQHSYLFRQQMNTTFEPSQPITGLPAASPVPLPSKKAISLQLVEGEVEN